MIINTRSAKGLGLLPKNVLNTLTARIQATTDVNNPQPIPGSCTPDGQFMWATAADGSVYLRQLRAGEVCSTTSGNNPTINQHNVDGSTTVTAPDGTVTTIPPSTNQSTGVPGPITVIYDFDLNEDASSSDPDAAKKSLQVGPFVIPLGARRYTIHWSGLLPQDWADFINPELAHDCSNCAFTSLEDATPGHTMGVLRDFLGNGLPTRVNKDLVTVPGVYVPVPTRGVAPRPTIKVSLPDQPIAVVSRPDNGETWGMFMVVLPKDPSYPWDSTTNPYELNFFWRKQPQGVWDWIKRIVGAIVGFVASELCQMLPTASKVPNPYVMAGAVVLSLSGACNPSCPTGMTYHDDLKICACPMGLSYDAVNKVCAVMPPIKTGPSYTTWIIGGLLALGAVLAISSKKHPKVS